MRSKSLLLFVKFIDHMIRQWIGRVIASVIASLRTNLVARFSANFIGRWMTGFICKPIRVLIRLPIRLPIHLLMSLLICLLVCLLVTASLSGFAHGAEFKAKLVKCNDGDTCEFRTENGKKIKVRFSGIDAPEKGYPFSTEAQRFAVKFFSNAEVDLKCEGKSFKRNVCEARVNSVDFGETIVSQGLAWESPKYSNGRFRNHQERARNEKRGLWSARQIESPTCQRRKSKRSKVLCLSHPLYQE